MKIKFIEVGRNNINFEADCKGELTYDWLYKQVKNYLLSSDIDFLDNGVIVVGGIRPVGRFEIVGEGE